MSASLNKQKNVGIIYLIWVVYKNEKDARRSSHGSCRGLDDPNDLIMVHLVFIIVMELTECAL